MLADLLPEVRGDTTRPERQFPTEIDLDVELSEMHVSMPGQSINPSQAASEVETSRLRDCGPDYRLGHLIGKGGQGEVFAAHQVQLGRTVALKRAGASPQVQRDFFKEAFTSAQLDHPNIVPVYELGVLEHQGNLVPVLAMKKVEGSTWSSLLRLDREWREDGLEEYLSRHLPILIQVINAVAYAHSKLIIHRDLKPSQVMVGHFGEVFLLDWGLAVYLGAPPDPPREDDLDSKRLFTRESATCPAGTPAYMSPEQALSTSTGLGQHTDLYLIGAILYELLTGRPPHAEKTVGAAVESARRNIVIPIGDSAPLELRLLTERCLETDPASRPASALEIKAALEQYLTGSGRKIDSRRLVNDVRQREHFGGYDDLSQAARLLSQAAHLWPDNPDVSAEHQRLLTHFVATAIGSGHFQLAYLQASRVADKALGEHLRSKVMDAQEAALRAMPRPRLLTLRRTAALLAVYLVIAVGVYGMVFYARQTVMGEVQDKVRSVATLAARDIDVSDLVAVNRTPDINSPEFQRVLGRLNAYRRANDDIRYIYTYRPNMQISQNSWRVLVDGDPSDIDVNGNGMIELDEKGNPPGNLYEEGTAEMFEAFDKKTTTSAVLIDQWGSFVSGFAPVLDPDSGDAVAIVGVDVRLSAVEKRLNVVTRAGLAVGAVLAALLTAALLAWFNSRSSLRMVRLLEEELRRQSRELGERAIHLG
jgi:serine/threonine protein kinase